MVIGFGAFLAPFTDYPFGPYLLLFGLFGQHVGATFAVIELL